MQEEEPEQLVVVVERMQSYKNGSGIGVGGENAKPSVVYLEPGGSLTLLESHANPSKMPSPVVAQLGSTFHT